MDRAYMLNDYIKEQDEDLVARDEADSNLSKLQFRIQGSKTVEEIKNEVSIFLEKNNVPFEVEEELRKICRGFSEDTNVYQASVYLENYMKQYLADKDTKQQASSDTVQEIKEELVDSVERDLDNVGVTVAGSHDVLIDSIQSEADVYKLKDNVEATTEYLESRKEVLTNEDKTLVELSSEEVAQVLENPTDETLLNNVLTQEEKQNNSTDKQVDVKEDGSVVVQGDALNPESMNFAAMMTTALVASDGEFGFDQKLDMKFIKDPENTAAFKIIYGDFPLPVLPNNTVDPALVAKIGNLANNYQSQVSYMDLLGTKSPELMTAFTLIQEQILNDKGAFQMAVKNGGKEHAMVVALDENYAQVSTAFHESGAMVTHDAMEHSIIRVNNTTPGEQLMILSATVDNLRQRKVESTMVAQNVYQKQLVYPNEAANAHKTFLIVVLVAEMLLILVGSYFLFM